MTTQPNEETPAPDGSTTETQHLPALRPAPAQLREPESTVPAETTKTRRGRWFRYTLPGSWVALVFVCLSFTPSLLPRSWLLQAIVCGINGSIGYGLGVVGASVWRAFADRDPRPARRRSWAIFLVTAVVALPLAAAVGQWWQRQLRELMSAVRVHRSGAAVSRRRGVRGDPRRVAIAPDRISMALAPPRPVDRSPCRTRPRLGDRADDDGDGRQRRHPRRFGLDGCGSHPA